MTEQTPAPVPQMIYTETLVDATIKLLEKVERNKAPIEIWDSNTDELMVHIVAPDYDLRLLEQITDSRFVDTLLNIAEWTGLTSMRQLLYARAELIAGGVDVEMPDWAQLEKRPHTIAELIALDKLDSNAGPMLASGYPISDWTAAVDDITEVFGKDRWKGEAARLASLGAAEGLSPAQTVQRVKDVLAAGVSEYNLEHAFGPDAPPADLLAVHGAALAENAASMQEAGLQREHYFGLLREGVDPSIVHGFVNHGKITDPDQIKTLYADGAHPVFMARARAEGLPVERWAQVMGPLRTYVGESTYGGWVSGIGSQTGLYRLEELSLDGVALPMRVAWENPVRGLPAALTPEQQRTLADRGVVPAEFLAVFWRLPQNHSYFSVDQRPVTDEDLEEVISVMAAGPDVVAILERLIVGAIDSRSAKRRRLRTTAAQLRQLVKLAPTDQEALYLGSVTDSARSWIGQLQLWRRFEPETAEFTQMLHDMPEIKPFLVWLGKQNVSGLFYGKNPIRTEAVRMVTSKNPKGARPSYLHFVILAEALERNANPHNRQWTVEAVEGSKRLRHQIARFMQAMSIVAREEHLGDSQYEIAPLHEIEA